MDGLREGAVAGRVPGGDTDPFFSGGVERNTKAAGAERRVVGPRHNLPPGALAIAPDDLDEFKRKSPLQVRDDFAPSAVFLHRPARDEDFARADKEVARAQGAIDRT